MNPNATSRSSSAFNAKNQQYYEITPNQAKDLIAAKKNVLRFELVISMIDENETSQNKQTRIYCRLSETMEKALSRNSDEEDPKEQGDQFDKEENRIEAEENSEKNSDSLLHSIIQDNKNKSPVNRSSNELKCHVCYICGKGFKFISQLRCHNITYHNNLKPFKCGQCPETFEFLHCVKGHEHTHIQKTSETAYQSETCPKTVYLKQDKGSEDRNHDSIQKYPQPKYENENKHSKIALPSLKQHVQNNLNFYKWNEPAYKCELCPKLFLSKLSISHHRKAHQVGGYPCAECGVVMWYKQSLKQHMAAHQKKKHIQWWKCDKCESRYNTEEKLARHRMLHYRSVEHRCHYCNRVFYTPTNLRQHIISVHLKLKAHPCAICGMCFAKESCATEHTLRIHYRQQWAVWVEHKRNKKESRFISAGSGA